MKILSRARVSFALLALVALLSTLLALTGRAEASDNGSLVAVGDTDVHPELAEKLETLPGHALLDVFVHFGGGSAADHRSFLENRGLTVAGNFASVDVAYAWGSVSEIRGLTRQDAVDYLEPNRELAFAGDTAGWATRSEIARNPVLGGPYRDADGNVLDGSGVGVAIVDSGIDGTHPDLDTRIAHNYKIVCSTPFLINVNTQQCFGPLVFVDTTNTDSTSGHGTHVAGIVAGEGEASQGTYTGVAPGATLFGYSTGEVISVLYAAEAFQHIFDNYESFNPRIRVVNNSWGDDPQPNFDPDSVWVKLSNLLVEQKGVTMVYAAGNSGSGNGNQDRTSSTCKIPTPGVICVANYDDNDTGARDGSLSSTSSRGMPGAANAPNWPDISAPGTFYTSTCRPTMPLCNLGPTPAWAPNYANISGTSMASPHTAGAATLLYQADPSLAPAEVEDVLQDTARKFTFGGGYVADPQNPDGTISHDKGAGLLNVHAALDALGVAHDGSAGGSSSDPTINVTSPGQDEVFDGASTIPVEGTAFDGVSSATPTEQVIVSSDDEGGLVQPGALDIQRVTALETATAMEYRITLRNAADRPSGANATFRITQNVEGVPFLSNIVLPPSGPPTPAAASSSNTAPATAVSLDGNTIVMEVPFGNLGSPGPNSVGHNVFASAFMGGIVDVAPGGPGADVIARPRYGAPYEILRSDGVVAPAATVGYSVDGGLEQSATVSGSSPNYTWSGTIDPTGLTDGTHTLMATLYLGGVPSATDTTSFVIEREQSFSYDVVINSPADGSDVPRALVEIRGTSSTDDPAGIGQVTVQITDVVTGGVTYDSGELVANGTAPWAKDFDFGKLDEGSYAIAGRAYSGGSVVATHTVMVAVPAESPGQVACAGRGLGFWRQQFSGSGSNGFTDDEADQLADYAARLSDGYFEDRNELISVLTANGNKNEEVRSARHFATLLLNLAGGDLSGEMSTQVGLDGSEQLDPTVYNTVVVGDTVNEAAEWIRGQFPDGDHAAAAEVAEAINDGHGLDC